MVERNFFELMSSISEGWVEEKIFSELMSGVF